MISSIFGKTKPINYIIILGSLFLFYWIVHFLLFESTYSPEQLLTQTVVLGILLFSIFVVNFIVKRNQITGTNAFTILYYSLLIIVFSEVLMDNNAVLCSFFLLLSQRRLISLRSLKNIKLKIFDATLWIVVSSFFYDWALLYLILIFTAIFFYEPKNIRNWLVPFIGVFTIGIITVCFLILTDNLNFLLEHYRFSLSFDTNFLAYWTNSTKLVVYITVIIVTGFFAFLELGKLGLGRIITMRLIAISFVIGLVVTIFKSSSDVFPVLIIFFPGAVLLTKYVEVIRRSKLKEIILIASVLIPLIIFITEMSIK